MSEETLDSLKQAIAALIESNDILQDEVTRLRFTSSTLRRVNSALRESVASLRRQIEQAAFNDDTFKRFFSGEFDAPGKYAEFDAMVANGEGGLPTAADSGTAGAQLQESVSSNPAS